MILHTCIYMKNEMTLSPHPHIATHTYVASYPGLLTPVFVAYTTNVGKGLVKLSDVV